MYMYIHTNVNHLPFINNFRDINVCTQSGLLTDDEAKYVTRLHCYKFYSQKEAHQLPTHIEFLKMSSIINSYIEFTNLTHLHISYSKRRYSTSHEHTLSVLPENLVCVKLYGTFNQPIRGLLPPNLKRLTLGDYFTQEIDDTLPEYLEYLKFGIRFNDQVYGYLPRTLKYLEFGNRFRQPIGDHLPDGLEVLVFGKDGYRERCNITYFPKSIQRIEVHDA